MKLSLLFEWPRATSFQRGLVLVSRTRSIKTSFPPQDVAQSLCRGRCVSVVTAHHASVATSVMPPPGGRAPTSKQPLLVSAVLCGASRTWEGGVWRCRASEAPHTVCHSHFIGCGSATASQSSGIKTIHSILFALLYRLPLGCRNKNPFFGVFFLVFFVLDE